jgi:hypothetical protein
MSAAPPGGNGQIRRTGFSGYGEAFAKAAKAAKAADARNAALRGHFFTPQGIQFSLNFLNQIT